MSNSDRNTIGAIPENDVEDNNIVVQQSVVQRCSPYL